MEIENNLVLQVRNALKKSGGLTSRSVDIIPIPSLEAADTHSPTLFPFPCKNLLLLSNITPSALNHPNQKTRKSLRSLTARTHKSGIPSSTRRSSPIRYVSLWCVSLEARDSSAASNPSVILDSTMSHHSDAYPLCDLSPSSYPCFSLPETPAAAHAPPYSSSYIPEQLPEPATPGQSSDNRRASNGKEPSARAFRRRLCDILVIAAFVAYGIGMIILFVLLLVVLVNDEIATTENGIKKIEHSIWQATTREGHTRRMLNSTNDALMDGLPTANLTGDLTHSLVLPENNSTPAELETRAPPFDTVCDGNHNCDWGYKCVKGMCKLGCDDSDDCVPPQYCGKHFHELPEWEDFCLLKHNKMCYEHLHFCMRHSQCCSGYCVGRKRGSRWKLCRPRPGGRYNETQNESVE